MNALQTRSIDSLKVGYWADGELPENVRLGLNSVITAAHAFKQFRSRGDSALVIGDHCTMDGVHFSVGAAGKLAIGDYCFFANALLLCEKEIRIGDYVVVGWN